MGTDTFTELPDVVVTVVSWPPLIVNVKVYGAVPLAPVNVMFGEAEFAHIVVVPLIIAVGNGFTVTVAVPVWL